VLVVVHQLIPMLERFLQEKLGVDPSIAVVTRTNSFLEAISQELSHSTTLPSGKVVAPVDHELLWDVALSTAAGYVVASILEWPSKTPTAAVVRTLECIIDYHQTAVADGSRSAAPMSDTLLRALASLQAGISPRSKTAKLLLERAEAGIALVGDPIRDWQLARSLLAGTRELDDIFQKVRMLRLLRARDPLVWTLIRSWDGSSSYPGAVTHIQQVLQEEVLNSTYISDSAVILMSMHKSKGKEFDGVVIVEGLHHSKLLDPSWDSQATNAARRLLRVAITRARHQVIIVRPNHSVALIPPAVKE
jgi:DNA helicase-2/ATP-dependent DNA helicase PcrA